MSMAAFKPCPFCGTRVDDPNRPASEIQGGGFTIECGECGATWPLMKRAHFEAMSGDEDVVSFFNRRCEAT